ncbi:MAG: zinc ribbon domain-containing protein [Chloroflexi bacterium]|nr:zinc ribbon domain-containing protein [Chloroflexota bacterium]
MVATYEYQCARCQSVFELRRDWNAAAVRVACPTCQSADVFRLFSKIMTLSRGADGAARVIGGNGCGGCTATRCGGCASAKNK